MSLLCHTLDPVGLKFVLMQKLVIVTHTARKQDEHVILLEKRIFGFMLAMRIGLVDVRV